MTTHRPHPLTGPYPYGVRDADGDVVPRHPWADAHAVPLVERVPIDASVVYDDPEDALLYDACDRCAQHAEGVWLGSVDDGKLAALWQRMIAVERHETDHYRTRAEGDACRTLYAIACFVAHVAPHVDPWEWPWSVNMADADLRNVLSAWSRQ